jgi:hypothetical protein
LQRSVIASGEPSRSKEGRWRKVRRGTQQRRSCPAGERKQGSVKRHRIIIPTTVLVALICVAAPRVALAGSLLSGYGGPGEGSQALVGAALVKGPRGGSGGGSSGAGSPGLAEPSSASATASTPGATEQRSSSSSRSSQRSAGSSSHGSNASRTSAGGGGAAAATRQASSRAGFASYPRSERVVGQSASVVLGLSGADFAYALIALFCLLLTALATARLARRNGVTGVGG